MLPRAGSAHRLDRWNNVYNLHAQKHRTCAQLLTITSLSVTDDRMDEASAPPEKAGRAGGSHLWPFLIGLGVILAGFDLWSAGYKPAHKHINSAKPPIYGGYGPVFPSRAWIAIGLGLLACGVFFALYRAERIRRLVAVPVALVLSFSFAASIGYLRGGGAGPYASLLRLGDYHGDTLLARTIGIGTFIRKFPSLIPSLVSVHSRTHPPGPVVLLASLERLFPMGDVGPRAFVLAVLSVLILIPAWFIAERIGGKRAAVAAVCLLAVSPAIVMFTFTSMDAVFATILATVGALLLWGVTGKGNAWLAAAGGFAAGLATFMTYAVIFVVAAALITAVVSLPLKRALQVLGAAVLGGVLAIILLRVGVGFDLIASYRALRKYTGSEGRSYAYWVFGNVAAWLSFTGVPVGALAILAIKRHKPVFVAALLAPLLLFYLLPVGLTKLAPGEVERTWLFTQPFLAAAAGLAFVRWEKRRGFRRPAVLLVFLLLAAGQTIAMQVLFNTLW